jgi:asparagine synthase (glutamine-hydrolysing)
MDEKIANEFALVEEITAVVSQFDVVVKQPFLSEKFIKFAKLIPIDQKIKGSGDLTRKHVLRQVALSLGVPSESALKPKKALQYGSLIHKYFKKSQDIH